MLAHDDPSDSARSFETRKPRRTASSVAASRKVPR